MNEYMNVIAIIPARGGSQRVPAKNLLLLAGMPLVGHSILHAKRARCVSEVIVSTDSDDIADVARSYGADVVMRPRELADETASSESALLHVLDERKKAGKQDPDLVVFLQCTSPVRTMNDIDNAVEHLQKENADSLFSACRNFALIWSRTEDAISSLTYDYHTRRREQDMEVQYRENGSIYVTRTEILRKTGNRLGGNIAVYEMDEFHSFQVDTPRQVDLLRWIVRHDTVDWPSDIALVVFDFDGVMTDNIVRTFPSGKETVSCSRSDSLGVSLLRKAGVPMMVLSTEEHEVVAKRCKKMKLPCHQGIDDKASYLREYLQDNAIDPAKVAYVGNDINDLGCLELVGFPVVVADADPAVLDAARVVLSENGGKGAVREFCDKLLAARSR